MLTFRQLLAVGFAAATLSHFTATTACAAPGPVAKVRFIHAIAGATNLNFRLNMANTAKNVSFLKGSTFKKIAANFYEIDATTVQNVATVLPPQNFNLSADLEHTVIATGSIAGGPAIHLKTVSLPPAGLVSGSQLVIYNGLADTLGVEVILDGASLTMGLLYDDIYGPFTGPEGDHTLEIKHFGTTVLGPTTLRLKKKKAHFVVLQGTIDTTDAIPTQAIMHITK